MDKTNKEKWVKYLVFMGRQSSNQYQRKNQRKMNYVKVGTWAIAALLLSSLKACYWISEPNWIYSTYSNGTTTIGLAEDLEVGHRYSGYEIVIGGEKIYGEFHIDHIHSDQTYTYFTGTFIDFCTGEISIRRPQPQSELPMVAQVTWIVNRQPVDFNYRSTLPNDDRSQNQDCTVPNGQKIQLNLPEAVPQPDSQGEFTRDNSRTFLLEGRDFYVWPQWRVLAHEAQLDCHGQPDDEVIQYSYQSGEIITKFGGEMLEGSNLIKLSDGTSWLKTQEKCYVRASNRHLAPVSLPTKFW
ncbi:MAG: hypothetical protein AAF773_06245 [Cyanobacteria bacterium P01_D01_bin.115]